MIIPELKQILTDSGCTIVIYESEEQANIRLDESNLTDIVGLILEPDECTLEVRANAIAEHFSPQMIQVLVMADLEDTADNHYVKLQNLLNICKQIIVRLIGLAEFKTLTPLTVRKVKENRYDANLIGWSMPLNLYIYKNEIRYPCL